MNYELQHQKEASGVMQQSWLIDQLEVPAGYRNRMQPVGTGLSGLIADGRM